MGTKKSIPLSYLIDMSDKLTIWEAVAIWMVEESGYSRRQGAELLHRTKNNLVTTYYTAKGKLEQE